jgi:hypothetical protein
MDYCTIWDLLYVLEHSYHYASLLMQFGYVTNLFEQKFSAETLSRNFALLDYNVDKRSVMVCDMQASSTSSYT